MKCCLLTEPFRYTQTVFLQIAFLKATDPALQELLKLSSFQRIKYKAPKLRTFPYSWATPVYFYLECDLFRLLKRCSYVSIMLNVFAAHFTLHRLLNKICNENPFSAQLITWQKVAKNIYLWQLISRIFEIQLYIIKNTFEYQRFGVVFFCCYHVISMWCVIFKGKPNTYQFNTFQGELAWRIAGKLEKQKKWEFLFHYFNNSLKSMPIRSTFWFISLATWNFLMALCRFS